MPLDLKAMYLKHTKYRCFHLPRCMTPHSNDISLLAVYATLVIWVVSESKLKSVVSLMQNEVAHSCRAFTQAYRFHNWTQEIVLRIHFRSNKNVHILMCLSPRGDTIWDSLVICYSGAMLSFLQWELKAW